MRRAPAVLATILLLCGCTAQPVPTAPAPTASAEAPTTAPTSEPPTVASISIVSDGVTLVGDDGSALAFLDYFLPQAEASEVLADTLGFEPERVDVPGVPNSDQTAYTYFDFDGLHVLGPGVDGTVAWKFRITTDVLEVRGIPVVTFDGFQVGVAEGALTAYSGYATVLPSATLYSVPGADGYRVTLTVTGGSVTSITAPVEGGASP